ncbi:unnamed protein product [Euphydryas editha]|uniref:Transposase n=1 Tax=Euphydryas editha TaxID=104508 RepID=A0AAU9VGT0_EUPED|nr:unnamed protein product [Euphydryas editha]
MTIFKLPDDFHSLSSIITDNGHINTGKTGVLLGIPLPNASGMMFMLCTYHKYVGSEQHTEEDVEYEQLMRDVDILDFGEFGGAEPPKMTAVRCAAHTLQLSIRDACVQLEHLFDRCRRVARALWSPNNALRLRENELPQAIIDCPKSGTLLQT